METTLALAGGAIADLLPLADWDHDGGPGWIFGLLFWAVAIAMVVLLVRNRGWWGPGRPSDRESAVEVLERRFAEGELSAEEYRERRSVLEQRRDD